MKMDNESVLREILEQSLAGYWDWDISSGDEYMSPTFKKMFGYENHEIPNRADSWQKLIFAEDLPGVLEKFDAHVKSKGVIPYYNEIRYRHKNGSTVWIICTGKVIEWNEKGEPVRMVGCHVDITARKKTEEALSVSEQRLRLAHKASNDVVWDWDIINDTQKWNEAGKTAFGWTEIVDGCVNAHWWVERVHPDDQQRINDSFFAVVNNPQLYSWNDEYRFLKADGSYANVIDRGFVLRNAQGKAVRMIGAMLDITERKTAELETRSLLHASRAVLEGNSFEQTARIIFDCCREVTGAKSGYVALLSDDGAENKVLFLESGGLSCTVDPSLPMPVRGLRAIAYAGGNAVFENNFSQSEWVALMPSGHVSLKNVMFVPLNLKGKAIGVIGLANKDSDFTANDVRIAGAFGDLAAISLERALSDKSLRQNEEKYRNLFNNAEVGMFRSRLDGSEFLESNDKYLSILGRTREETIGKPTNILWADPKEREKMVKTLKAQYHVESLECRLLKKDGSIINCITSLRLYPEQGFLEGSVMDITNLKRMEKALANTQKLEALGQLAGGIAHDFNNLLGGIYGYMDMASEITTDHKLRQYIFKAMNTIDRGRHLTQQLLTFAKGGAPIKSTAKLFPHLREIAQFALSGSNISCSFDISDSLHACSFDKNQITQVIDNIIINAKQAMPDGGTIEISARNITFEHGQHGSLGKGNYIQISIRDHGIGMPKEILPRIFDPFYTTKATGHGLGLATCYSIIKRHEGCIDVESDPGKGSTFHIYLPATTDASEVSEETSKTTHKGIGTIILMDDEEVIRETTADMLESFGYNVITAEEGQEAVDILSAEIAAKKKITALILDLTIPGGMGGKETINEIRKISTKIPVFVASGYAENPVMANPKEYGFIASICKPFKKSDLAELLNFHLVKSK